MRFYGTMVLLPAVASRPGGPAARGGARDRRGHDAGVLAAIQALGGTLGSRIEGAESAIAVMTDHVHDFRARFEGVPGGLNERIVAIEARLKSAPTSIAITKLHEKIADVSVFVKTELDKFRDRREHKAAALVVLSARLR